MLPFMMIITLFVFLVAWYIYKKAIPLQNDSESENEEVIEEDNKRYILNVSTFHEDGGVSSHWHGWSSKWLFTREEAFEEKKKIAHLFDTIEVIEYSVEEKEITEEEKEVLEDSE